MIPQKMRGSELIGRKVLFTEDSTNGAGYGVTAHKTEAVISDVVRGAGIEIKTIPCPYCGQYTRISHISRKNLALVPNVYTGEMNEIHSTKAYLARGNSDGKAWVYGSYVNVGGKGHLIVENEEPFTRHVVDRDSVGLYTQYFDKHKRMIFEGDIIKLLNGARGIVRFGEYTAFCPADEQPMANVGFFVESPDLPDMPLGPTEEYAEILDNVYEGAMIYEVAAYLKENEPPIFYNKFSAMNDINTILKFAHKLIDDQNASKTHKVLVITNVVEKKLFAKLNEATNPRSECFGWVNVYADLERFPGIFR